MKDVNKEDFFYNIVLAEVNTIKDRLENIINENEEIKEASENLDKATTDMLITIENLSKIIPDDYSFEDLTDISKLDEIF